MARFNTWQLAAVAPALLVALALSTGCQHRDAAKLKVEAMGTSVAVGKLTYTVVESEWRDILDKGNGEQRMPQHKFLMINLTVANNGSGENAAPLLQLIDSKGETHAEVSEGDGVPEWLGYLRLLQPRESRSGRVLFDIPQGPCQLRVSSGGDPESEEARLVDIPLQVIPELPHSPSLPAPIEPAPSK